MRVVGGEIVYWTWHACPATCEAKFASISSIDVLIDFICVFRSLIVLFLSFIIDCRNSLCVMLKSSSSSDSSIEHWKPRIRRTRPSKMSIFSEKTFYQRHDIEGFRAIRKLPARVFLMSLRFSSPQTSVILFFISSFEVLSVTTSACVSDKPCSSSFIVSVSFARSLSNLKSLSEL